MNDRIIPPSFEDHTSPLHRSNDGHLVIVPQTNPPKSFVVADERDDHVELFTQKREIADAFVAGYDYAERLQREPQHVVIVLDLDSDDPGITSVSKPLTREHAEALAESYAIEHGLTRGVHVQTALVG